MLSMSLFSRHVEVLWKQVDIDHHVVFAYRETLCSGHPHSSESSKAPVKYFLCSENIWSNIWSVNTRKCILGILNFNSWSYFKYMIGWYEHLIWYCTFSIQNLQRCIRISSLWTNIGVIRKWLISTQIENCFLSIWKYFDKCEKGYNKAKSCHVY